MPCLDLETLSAFVAGTLDDDSREQAIAHLSQCAECRLIVARAVLIEDEKPAKPSVSIMAIAAAVVLAIITAGWLLSRTRRSDPGALLASAAPRSARSTEPRLAGFRWAPFRNLLAGAQNKSADELTARSVAEKVLGDLENNGSPRALHAKGVAYLIRDNASAAVSTLREASRAAADNAAVWNDFAAALYVDGQSEAELQEALAAARRAVRIDPRLAEGYFNIALILERIGANPEEIKGAWRDYLRHDPSGAWADEARDRLAHYQQGQ